MANIGYARVSSGEQTTDLQLDALNNEKCSRIFEEKASGAQRDRPQLIEALAYLREGDTLVVWKLDRLARSLTQLIETIEHLHDKGCGLRSITESIDTATSSGRLFFHIFGALAEFERSIIRERTIAGLAAARARGRRGGRPKALADDRLAAAVTLIKGGQLTIREVGQQLGISASTIYKHLPKPRSSLAK
jgi:DNA invertase Pin-like site-specific DNA recombinase